MFHESSVDSNAPSKCTEIQLHQKPIFQGLIKVLISVISVNLTDDIISHWCEAQLFSY